jgi:hypothetical protein
MEEVKFIRVKRDGTVYPFSEVLAENPQCEVITEEEAFPDKFPKAKPKVKEVKAPRNSVDFSIPDDVLSEIKEGE